MWFGERVHLPRLYDEYAPRHGCGNFAENKIRVEGIYHDKRWAQGKVGQDSTWQSL